ncbi:MAG: tyrosine-type recombinase/integrase [Steroidobacteraceae bacterium]
MPLTDAAIRKALKLPDRQKLTDGDGMYLLIDPPRTPGWRLKYRIAGREKLLSLGVYPRVALQRARQKREDARRLIGDGIDPSAERKAERAANSDTFRVIAEDWLARQAKALAPETVSILQGRLTSTLLPAFGSRPLSDIKAADLLAVLRRLEDKGIHETAHRVRALYGRVARFAIATGRAERDVSGDLRGALTPVVAEHFPAITEPRRIGELLRAIDSYNGQPSVEYALKLAPYVFVRPGELRGAAWREFALEGKEPEWRLPGERMKMGREHIVPLASQVVKLLRRLYALTGDGALLFPGLRTGARPISNTTLNAALRRLDFGQDEMTAHGFRSMASTRLNEMNFAPDIIELQLAHAEKSEARAAYNRALRLPERRKMMQRWADYLDGLKGAGNL